MSYRWHLLLDSMYRFGYTSIYIVILVLCGLSVLGGIASLIALLNGEETTESTPGRDHIRTSSAFISSIVIFVVTVLLWLCLSPPPVFQVWWGEPAACAEKEAE